MEKFVLLLIFLVMLATAQGKTIVILLLNPEGTHILYIYIKIHPLERSHQYFIAFVVAQCDGGSRPQIEHCCSSNNPCNANQGDCDNDSECGSGLVCGRNNCGPSFTWGSADCCIPGVPSVSNTLPPIPQGLQGIEFCIIIKRTLRQN